MGHGLYVYTECPGEENVWATNSSVVEGRKCNHEKFFRKVDNWPKIKRKEKTFFLKNRRHIKMHFRMLKQYLQKNKDVSEHDIFGEWKIVWLKLLYI